MRKIIGDNDMVLYLKILCCYLFNIRHILDKHFKWRRILLVFYKCGTKFKL